MRAGAPETGLDREPVAAAIQRLVFGKKFSAQIVWFCDVFGIADNATQRNGPLLHRKWADVSAQIREISKASFSRIERKLSDVVHSQMSPRLRV